MKRASWQRGNRLFFFLLLFIFTLPDAAAEILQPEAPLFVSIHLPYGISVELPRSWFITVGRARDVLKTTGQEDIDLSTMAVPDNNMLLQAAATPTDRPAAISVAFFPKTVLPSLAGEISPTELANYDRELHSTVENFVSGQGRKLLQWSGTRKDQLNGRVTLVSEYRRQSLGNLAVWEQVNAIPLDAGVVVLTITQSEQGGVLWRAIVMRIRSSCHITNDQ